VDKESDKEKPVDGIVADYFGEVIEISDDDRVTVSIYVPEKDRYINRKVNLDQFKFNDTVKVGMQIHYRYQIVGGEYFHHYTLPEDITKEEPNSNEEEPKPDEKGSTTDIGKLVG